jgi:hypothetical protein
MTYLEHADLRVTQYLGELKELLFDVIDGKADSKEASDSLVLLEELQEEFTIVSNSLKESDKLLGTRI